MKISDICDKLRVRSIEHNVTLAAEFNELGMSIRSVYRITNGQPPSFSQLPKLIQASALLSRCGETPTFEISDLVILRAEDYRALLARSTQGEN